MFISGDPFSETGSLHDELIKISGVLTLSIKTLLESSFTRFPGLHFKGIYLILYGTEQKSLEIMHFGITVQSMKDP